MKVSLVIPNFNGASFLPSCLTSIAVSLSTAKISQFEIIVVDNASTDDSVSKIKKTIPLLVKGGDRGGFNCKLKINSSNLGFAAAVNQGITIAKYPYVAVLNTDITLAPNWFHLLNQTIFHHPRIAVFCGTVLNHDGTLIESQGFNFQRRGRCLNLNNNQTFHKSSLINHKSKLVWGSSAAAVIYNKKIILKTGLFDQNFFAYIEDVDLSFRLHRQGYRTLFVPTAISYHLGGGTSEKMGNLRQFLTARNWYLLIFKNYSFQELASCLFPFLLERLRNLSFLLRRTPLLLWLPTLVSLYFQILVKISHDHRYRHFLHPLRHRR